MDDLYIDPNLEKLVTQRILFPAEKFDDVLVPRPRRYVIHAQPESRVREALARLLPDAVVVTLEEDADAEFPEEGVVVVVNAHLLTNARNAIPENVVVVAINNVPPHRMGAYWFLHFDYQLTYGVPSKEFLKKRFEARFDAFGLKHKVRVLLSKDDYEALAVAADHCTEKDVDEFCALVFRDVLFNSEKTISFEWLRQQEYFIDETSQKVSHITSRPVARQHGQYIVEPANKKLRLH
jgi:hypothetical protein